MGIQAVSEGELFAFFLAVSGYACAYENYAVVMDGSLEDARLEFNRLGSEGWYYRGNDTGHLIFSRAEGVSAIPGPQYELETIDDSETVQQFLDRQGEKGNLLVGYHRNYAIFL